MAAISGRTSQRSTCTTGRSTLADHGAQERFGRPYAELTPEDQAAIDGSVAAALRQNRYDPATGTLTLDGGRTPIPSTGRSPTGPTISPIPPAMAGLPRRRIRDPQELRQLTAFFAWTAWASVAERPGTSHSYTNNFPYDPLAGNHADRRGPHLQRHQPGVPARRHGDRAAGLRQVRLSGLAPQRAAPLPHTADAADRPTPSARRSNSWPSPRCSSSVRR